MFHFVETVRLLRLILPQLPPGGHPACNGEPTSTGTIDMDPSLYCTPSFYLLVLEVLWQVSEQQYVEIAAF